MAKFRYKAMKSDGTTYDGELDAPDRFGVYRQVKKEGGSVLSLTESGRHRLNMQQLNLLLARVKEDEKIAFAKNLSAMISAGLSLSRAIGVLARQTRNEKLKSILAGIEDTVKQGGTFHEGLAATPKVWSPLMIAMVRAGEESGKLADSLQTIGQQLERSHNLKKKVRGAMIYPAIVLFALVIIAFIMMTTIVPTLKTTFEELDVELPTSTKVILAVSDFLTEHTVLSILIMIAVAVLTVVGLRTPQGKRGFEFFILHIPIIGNLVKEVNSARIARTFSSLLSSGVEVMQGIDITKEVSQNSYYQDTLDEMKKKVGQGLPMAEIFEQNEALYPPFVGELVSVGEETGKLPEMLRRVAEFYENEVEQSTKDMSTVIEPFLMIVVGAVVGFFAVSMITPIYSIAQNI